MVNDHLTRTKMFTFQLASTAYFSHLPFASILHYLTMKVKKNAHYGDHVTARFLVTSPSLSHGMGESPQPYGGSN